MDRYGDVTAAASRARVPDRTGTAQRGAVSIAYAVYGDDAPAGRPTLVMLPAWSIVPSRIWKAQVPALSRHFRVVTFDGRGSGASSRPEGAAAYRHEEFAADTVAVMDAAGVHDAVLVSLSLGGPWSVHVAAQHPARVLGLFAIAPSCDFEVDLDLDEDFVPWSEVGSHTRGWAKYNQHYWLTGGYPDFVDFFFAQMFSEPHSTKQVEDGIAWALDVAPRTVVDTVAARHDRVPLPTARIEDLCAQVRCPVTVLQGDDDRIRPFAFGERMVELTAGSMLRIERGGHGPNLRDPVLVNAEIRRFAEQFAEPAADRERTWTRAAGRGPKRVLYISSPIGLGHARRDVAVVRELRQRHPDLQVDWLAQDPVTRVLAHEGERVHPASAWLAGESGHIEAESGEHDLHAFQAIRRMDEVLVNNFMVFDEVTQTEQYDLVVGDEAWDVDYFLHENPERKRTAYAWFTDFVGWLPMPDGGEHEAFLTADLNAEMIEQRARYHRLRDRSLFVGTPDDIVPDRFGPGLPLIRDWTQANFQFPGYVTGFDPKVFGDRDELRARLGYRPGELVCVVTVGGSGVGTSLLRRVLDAVPLARRLVPELRFVVVTGPRIDPRSLPRRRGARVVGFLPDLTAHLAASDVAIVQGGLSTCMELTALRRPFLYVPLRHHFEQQFHVRWRLERYGAGTHLAYDLAADPDALVDSLVGELGRQVDYRPVETDGAATAARLLADLL